MDFAVLKGQDDKTSSAVCDLLKDDAAFQKLSASEGSLIVQRDKEDDAKLAVGIKIAIDRGVLPADSGVGPVTNINVVGKTADAVASELMGQLATPKEGEGYVIVLQGLSGTGKGTTVGKLKAALPKCVTWSNGNVFRAVTHLVSEHCDATKTEFGKEALTAELLAATMKRLTFEKFGDDDFDVVIDGKTRVGSIANTVLKAPTVSQRVPTVAEQTQGEVVKFAAGAVKTLQEAGCSVLLEGRAQTLNYIPTPARFELVIEDVALLGQRRAAQRVMAAALEACGAGDAAPDAAACLASLKDAAAKLAA